MKVDAILEMVNHMWNLQKTFFVFSEVAENVLVSIEVSKSTSSVVLAH